MNIFEIDDGDLLGGGPQIEAWLGACRAPAAGEDFRARVLVSMEVAAEERRVMLAGHAEVVERPRDEPPVLAAAFAVMAVVMLVIAGPWIVPAGGEVKTVAAPLRPSVAPSDEPPDVHHALELLDARRDLFATVQAVGRSPMSF